jgi:hypothetical protein
MAASKPGRSLRHGAARRQVRCGTGVDPRDAAMREDRLGVDVQRGHDQGAADVGWVGARERREYRLSAQSRLLTPSYVLPGTGGPDGPPRQPRIAQ